MTPRYLVYGLIDPRNGELRYVGKSCSGLKRPRQHGHPSVLAKDCTYKANWIRSLGGQSFDIEVLEEFSSSDGLAEAEQFWIAYFRSVGCRLTNLTDGGEGCTASLETRKKMSRSHRGRPHSREHRERIAASRIGKSHLSERGLANLRVGRKVADQNGRVYASANDAARTLGLCVPNVRSVLRGHYRQTGGYVFRYIE